MRVVYFTAGTVGAGHLVRGIAIGRALDRAGFSGDYRMVGPPLPFAAAQRDDYETVELRSDATLRDPHLVMASELTRRLDALRPEVLLVDLFWAPLHWLLPALSCEPWLLLRLCPPRWLVGPPGMPFEPGRFRRVLAIEPFEHPAIGETIEPIVVANPEECRPIGALRERFGVPPGERLVAILHAGQRGEAAELATTAPPGRQVSLDLFEPGALFPAAEWLGGADHVVAGCGYNAFWEARWLGWAERTTFIPFPRSIDDQARRRATFGGHRPRRNGADALARLILAG